LKKPNFNITRPPERVIHLFSNDPRGFRKLPEPIQHKTRIWAICSGYAKPESRYWEWHFLSMLVDEAAKYTVIEKSVKRLTPAQRRKRKHAAQKAADERNKKRSKAERKRIARNKKARSIITVSGGKFS
jgi:hypothetical protein